MKGKRIFIAAIVVLLIAGAVTFGLLRNKPEQKTTSHSQLTGVEVETEAAERPVLSVMIGNSKAARPQTGLGSAGIVFEAVTEGGITRYLALYQEDMPENVGPVRSLRTHFLDWAMGFDASISHAGGSAEALEKVDNRDAKSLTQFTYNKPYYRDNDRDAPHNLYARTQDLRDLQDELDHGPSQFNGIPRSDDAPSASPSAPKVTIDFSSPLYKVEFRYDQDANSYTRYLDGEPHLDGIADQPITVKNVIVIKTQTQQKGVDAIGNGEALIFKDGNVQEVRWQKPDYGNRVKLIDATGEEIPLNRGASWFAALSEERPVTY